MLKKLIPILLFCYLQQNVSGFSLFSSDSLIVSEIRIEGNFITNQKIVFREIAFKINDIVGRDEVDLIKKTSIDNLTKTSLFNFVEIEIVEDVKGLLLIIIRLTERWYIWPNIYLNHTDRNFSEWWRTKDPNKLEYGVGLKINNFRGMGETLMLNYRFGNFPKFELDYRGILLDKAERHILSFLADWSAKKILPYNIRSDKQVFIKEDYNLLKSINITASYKYRRRYFNSHNIEFGYSDYRIADTIYSLNPYFAGINNHKYRYLNLKYEFMRDTRDSKIYPKTGNLFVAGINKKGLFLIPDEYNALDTYLQFLTYHKITGRFYAATGIFFFSTIADDYVFSSMSGLGYLQFVRGYEYYTINGKNSFLFKSFLKLEILPMKVINLKIWPIRKLHQFNRIPIEIFSNLFFDAGYVNDNSEIYRIYNNNLVNKIIYGTGFGIDFITYYDKVFRLDYSINALGESGLFIHWKAAIR